MSSDSDDPDLHEDPAFCGDAWDEGVDSQDVEESVPDAPCRRCGLSIDPLLPCPHCLAPSLIAKAPGLTPTEIEPFYLFKRILIGFVLQMIPALCLGWMVLSGHLVDDSSRKWGILVLESWDFLVVLGVFAWVGRVALRKPPRGVRIMTWLAMPVSLASVLVINAAYHLVLKEYLKVDVPLDAEWSPLWILMIAVQPAIVEELFFRYLALGSLARIMNVHGAVLVSSALFAMAHIYAPLSLPVLFFAGLFLGYLRVGSGGLLLPMMAHFLHNLTILWIEASQ